MAANWRFAVAGYTGGAAGLNGTWTVSHTTLCTWTVTVGLVTWTLNTAGSSWNLSGHVTSTTSAFSHSTTGWNCMTPNTLAYAGGTGDPGHPASVTITPA